MKILWIKPGASRWSPFEEYHLRHIEHALQAFSKSMPNTSLIQPMEPDKNQVSARTEDSYKTSVSRLFLHATDVYMDWRFHGLKRYVVEQAPDILVLGSARLGFIAKELAFLLPDTRILCVYDRVIYDETDTLYSLQRGPFKKIAKTIEKVATYQDERFAVSFCHRHITATERDAQRLGELYLVGATRFETLPICVPAQTVKRRKDPTESYHLVFWGSPVYRSNDDAVEWFLDYIWDDVRRAYPNIVLTIGPLLENGKLSERLKNEPRVIRHFDFSRMKELMYENGIFISPVYTRGRMLYPVADALAMGYPVIASEASLYGYDEVMEDSLSMGVVEKAVRPDEYIAAIGRMMTYEWVDLQRKARKLHQKYHSYERAERFIHRLLLSVYGKQKKQSASNENHKGE